MKFISLKPSTRPDKRFMITFSEPEKTIHFGAENGSTYLDHKDKTKRKNYLARHKVREDWTKVNAGSLSALLLWGDSSNISSNLDAYLRKFNISR
jgi:hypothetical protein